MDVMIVATRDCVHCPDLARELEALGIDYRVVFVEDDPELARRLAIRHSPNLVVDGKVVFRDMPSPEALRKALLGEA